MAIINQNKQTGFLPALAPIAPIIGAGIGGLSQIISNISARRRQKKQEQAELNAWKMQNEYNSPQAQMARYQAAGLSPNLAYTQGSSGNASSAPKIPDYQDGAFKPLDTSGIAPALQSFTDWEIKKQTLDNLRTQNSVIQNEAILKSVLILGQTTKNKQSAFNLGVDMELRDITVEAAKESLRKLQADVAFTNAENVRADQRLTNSTAETFEKVLSARIGRQLTAAQIANLKMDNIVKSFDAELAQSGIRPSDSVIYRLMDQFFTEEGKGIKEWGSNPQTIFEKMIKWMNPRLYEQEVNKSLQKYSDRYNYRNVRPYFKEKYQRRLGY